MYLWWSRFRSQNYFNRSLRQSGVERSTQRIVLHTAVVVDVDIVWSVAASKCDSQYKDSIGVSKAQSARDWTLLNRTVQRCQGFLCTEVAICAVLADNSLFTSSVPLLFSHSETLTMLRWALVHRAHRTYTQTMERRGFVYTHHTHYGSHWVVTAQRPWTGA